MCPPPDFSYRSHEIQSLQASYLLRTVLVYSSVAQNQTPWYAANFSHLSTVSHPDYDVF
jgi:hypothetical protein